MKKVLTALYSHFAAFLLGFAVTAAAIFPDKVFASWAGYVALTFIAVWWIMQFVDDVRRSGRSAAAEGPRKEAQGG